jgi:hypothetical protein
MNDGTLRNYIVKADSGGQGITFTASKSNELEEVTLNTSTLNAQRRLTQPAT